MSSSLEDANSPTKSTQNECNLSTNKIKAAVHYYLGEIAKSRADSEEMRKQFYKSHEEWEYLFKSFKKYSKI